MKRLLIAVLLALCSMPAAAQIRTIGGGGVTYPLAASDGTAAAPSIGFTNSTSLGIYRVGADSLGITANGRLAFVVRDSQMLAVAGRIGKPAYSFLGDDDTGLYKAGTTISIAINAGDVIVFDGFDQQIEGPTTGGAAKPTWSFASDDDNGVYRVGVDTLGFATGGVHSLRLSGGATPTLAGGAGNMTLLAGTGASRTLTLQTTNVSSTAQNALVLSGTMEATLGNSLSVTGDTVRSVADNLVLQPSGGNNLQTVMRGTNGSGTLVTSAIATFTNFQIHTALSLGATTIGTAAAPDLHWFLDANTGLYDFGADTIGFSTGGVHSLRLSGGAAVTLAGGAGNMVLLSGTGASRSLTLQGTNASSGVAAFISGVADTLKISNEALATSLTAAGATQNSMCIEATTKQLLENAASSCLVSSARFKQNIIPLSFPIARHIVKGLRPVSFQYRNGGRHAIGLIAEQADVVDARLTTRDGQGRVNSINYEQVTTSLLLVVQDQQRVIDSLRNGTRTAGSSFGLVGAIALGGLVAGIAASRRKAA